MAKETTRKKQVNKKQAQYERNRVEAVKRQRKIDDEDKVHLFSHGKNFDVGLLLIVFMLLTVGFIMILSASGPYSLRTEGDSYFYFKKQIEFAVAGVFLMFVVSKFDYRILNSKLSWLFYLGGLRTYESSYGSRYWCRNK